MLENDNLEIWIIFLIVDIIFQNAPYGSNINFP